MMDYLVIILFRLIAFAVFGIAIILNLLVWSIS